MNLSERQLRAICHKFNNYAPDVVDEILRQEANIEKLKRQLELLRRERDKAVADHAAELKRLDEAILSLQENNCDHDWHRYYDPSGGHDDETRCLICGLQR